VLEAAAGAASSFPAQRAVMTEPDATLERFVHRAGTLFTLPRVAVEVLELTRDPQVDPRLLKQCVEQDPALTAKLLRAVNSSLFAPARPVADLNQALTLLGTKPVKLLVLGFSLPDGLFRGMTGTFLARYWQHTLTKAVAAREICERVWRMSGDEAFLAALLQDLGMLVLVQELGAPYLRFIEQGGVGGAHLAELERAALGFDHCELTGRLLAHWRLPETLIAAAASPQSTEAFDRMPPTKRALPQVLHLAELLTVMVGENRTRLLPELLRLGRHYHGMTLAQLDDLVATLKNKVYDLADVLSLELPDGRDYRDVLLQAQTRLAQVAADAAGDLAVHDHPAHADEAESAVWHEARSLADAVAADLHLDRPAGRKPGSADAAPRRHHGRRTDGGQHGGCHGTCEMAQPAAHRPVPTLLRDHDPMLAERLAKAAAACRTDRTPLSLLLIELDGFDDLAFALGNEHAQRIVRIVRAGCRSLASTAASCEETREACLALILPACDRMAAVEAANSILRQVRSMNPPHAAGGPPIRVSIGAATANVPARNFDPGDLIAAADRCLFAAQSAGGNAAKSIEA
jgi:HD-like signal output (HDOD) protein/GGDEF domain-containing protein